VSELGQAEKFISVLANPKRVPERDGKNYATFYIEFFAKATVTTTASEKIYVPLIVGNIFAGSGIVSRPKQRELPSPLFN